MCVCEYDDNNVIVGGVCVVVVVAERGGACRGREMERTCATARHQCHQEMVRYLCVYLYNLLNYFLF